MDVFPTKVKIPSELSAFFSETDFENYPIVKVPQFFLDDRGTISNVADGRIGDVAVITSRLGSVRANHTHAEDWHLSYMVYGEMTYRWKDQGENIKSQLVVAGNLVFTPKNVPHRMDFHSDSCFIAISRLSRMQENYELDTLRLNSGYFDDQR